ERAVAFESGLEHSYRFLEAAVCQLEQAERPARLRLEETCARSCARSIASCAFALHSSSRPCAPATSASTQRPRPGSWPVSRARRSASLACIRAVGYRPFRKSPHETERSTRGTRLTAPLSRARRRARGVSVAPIVSSPRNDPIRPAI